MPIKKIELVQLLQNAFPNSKIEVNELKDDGDHYKASIISSKFNGKSRIEQHQMVYSALKGKMGGELHALMLKTKAK
tara:strand:- start:1436 stop:1666 length:231 start_codon:yes stop_codon:yes gene_type:complete